MRTLETPINILLARCTLSYSLLQSNVDLNQPISWVDYQPKEETFYPASRYLGEIMDSDFFIYSIAEDKVYDIEENTTRSPYCLTNRISKQKGATIYVQ